MKTRSTTVMALTLVAAAALMVAGWLASDVAAQDEPPKEAEVSSTSVPCRAVAAELEIMAGELFALDEALRLRAEDLHATDVEARLDALTAVTQELIDQRRTTIKFLKSAHQKLIVHLTEHAMTGDRETARQALDDCPVMKQMSGKPGYGGSGKP